MNVIKTVQKFWSEGEALWPVAEIFITLVVAIISLQSIFSFIKIHDIYLVTICFVLGTVFFLIVRKNHITKRLDHFLSGEYCKNTLWGYSKNLAEMYMTCFVVLMALVVLNLKINLVLFAVVFFLLLFVILLIRAVKKNQHVLPAAMYLLFELSVVTIYSLFITLTVLSFFGVTFLDMQKIEETRLSLMGKVAERLFGILMIGASFALGVYIPLRFVHFLYDNLFGKRKVFIPLCVFIFSLLCFCLIAGFLLCFKMFLPHKHVFVLFLPQNLIVYQFFYLTYPIWKQIYHRCMT